MLEVADTPFLLEVVVQNLLHIAKVTPQNLSPHFKVSNIVMLSIINSYYTNTCTCTCMCTCIINSIVDTIGTGTTYCPCLREMFSLFLR